MTEKSFFWAEWIKATGARRPDEDDGRLRRQPDGRRPNPRVVSEPDDQPTLSQTPREWED